MHYPVYGSVRRTEYKARPLKDGLPLLLGSRLIGIRVTSKIVRCPC